jgi:dolichyl-diphosphooligosaccharide--protein glycosyltransferase
MLVVTPIFCILGGIGASEVVRTASNALVVSESSSIRSINSAESRSYASGSRNSWRLGWPLGTSILFFVLSASYFFVIHSTWITAQMYSSPQVVLRATGGNGEPIYFDDFREAYGWLSHNTRDDAKILSWWDYGYQITGFGNRTVIVDNNTRNNTHIAKAGFIMASSEHDAMHKIKQLDVDYLLVVFGGRVGYSSDDINKFLWMVRISGGIFPEIVEEEYYSDQGAYTTCAPNASKRMRDSLMYKMCYYRFGETYTAGNGVSGYDRVRRCEIAEKDIKFDYLEEAFTSEHWLVRIYRVKKDDNLERKKVFP